MYLVPFSYTRRPAVRSAGAERFFDDAIERFFAAPWMGPADTETVRTPTLDVAETEQAYTATIDLPGVEKKDIAVAIDGRRVSVEANSQRADEKKDGDRVLYRERSAASYSRSFTLPQEVDAQTASAKLDNGVLTLTLPKRNSTAVQRLTVN